MQEVRSEVTIGRSRMDFLITGKDGTRTLVVEIHPLVLSYEEGKIPYHHPIPVCFHQNNHIVPELKKEVF